MSVNDQPSSKSYATDGVSTVFAFPYYLARLEHLAVELKNDTTGVVVALANGGDFTIAGTLVDGIYPAGADVTLLAVQPSGYTLTLLRRTPLTQPNPFQPHDPFPARTFEHSLDNPILILQERLAGLRGVTSGEPPGVGTTGDWYLNFPFLAGGVFAWAWCDEDVDGNTVNDWRPVGNISL